MRRTSRLPVSFPTRSSRLLVLGAVVLGTVSAQQSVPVPARPISTPAPLPELQPVPSPLPALVPVLTPLMPAPTPAPATTAPRPATVPRPRTAPRPAQPSTPSAAVSNTPVPRPSDPLYGRQWNLQSIQVPGAWAQLPLGRSWGPPVTVAVLDTGYVDSPELSGRVVNGYDFVSDPARSGDGDGRDQDASATGQYAYHGEVVANLIAAAHDGRGMAGLNPQARILHVRVAGNDGLIEVQDLVDGLKWAAGIAVPGVPANPNPARLLNLSLYADFIPLTRCDPRVQAAVDAVTARGTLVIAGAANDGADAAGYSPAGCRNVLTVTSVTQGGQRPAYANWGRTVALGAPGGEQGNGIPASSVSGMNGERSPDGTSFAAPHATGVASLLLTVRPRLTPAQVRDLLTRTVTPFVGGCDPDPVRTCGAGLLNASGALQAALASAAGAVGPGPAVKTSPAPVRPVPAPTRTSPGSTGR